MSVQIRSCTVTRKTLHRIGPVSSNRVVYAPSTKVPSTWISCRRVGKYVAAAKKCFSMLHDFLDGVVAVVDTLLELGRDKRNGLGAGRAQGAAARESQPGARSFKLA